MEDLCPAFRVDKVGSECPLALAVSQVPLIQNSQYAKVTYFNLAYSVSLHTKVQGYQM